jgi:hypothetical protein
MWTLPAFAQVDTAWVRRYNGPENLGDFASAIAVDDAGNVYVTGGSGTIKYDVNGNQLWVRVWGGSVAAFDTSGNIYLTGVSWGNRPNFDYTTIKYYPNGDTAWVRRYTAPEDSTDYANSIALDRSGNVYVTGYSWSSETAFDYATVKYDPEGNEIWVRRYDGPGNGWDQAWGIVIDSFDNIYVTGQSSGSETSYDYATIKYYPNGDTAWIRRYNGPADAADGAGPIVVDGSGNVYVGGYSRDTVTSDDCVTIKYDSSGNEAWVKRYNGPGDFNDGADAIAVDILNNLYVIGTSYGGDTGDDYATIKYDSDGNELWVRRFNGLSNYDDLVNGLVLDDCGGVYVTGYSDGNLTSFDYATVKYDSSGNELWVKRYNGPGNGWDWATDLTLSFSGDLYVTGWSLGNGTDYDYATIKYVQEEVFIEEGYRSDIVQLFILSQNYPNPFNPQTVIEYSLNSPSQVMLRIYNIKGQLVKTLIDGHREKGFHQISWDGKDEKGKKTSSGIYFYQLKIKDYVEVKKMVKLR